MERIADAEDEPTGNGHGFPQWHFWQSRMNCWNVDRAAFLTCLRRAVPHVTLGVGI